MADRGNQFVLGVFVATFLYSLLVLRSIRVRDDGSGSYFVPHLAVNVAMRLAVLAIGVLVYFIHHISDPVQIWTLARQVRTEPAWGGRPALPGADRRGPPGRRGLLRRQDIPDRLDVDGVPLASQETGTSKVSTRRTGSRWPANTT